MEINTLKPGERLIWSILGATSVAFHLTLVFWGLVPALISRPVHMLLALPWVLLFGAQSKWQIRSGILLGAAGALCCAYIVLNEADLSDQYGSLDGPIQTIIASLLLLVVLEMARRAIGWPLPLVAVLALLYGIFGQYFPGEFGHPGIPLNSFLGTMTIAEGGLWGKLTSVSVDIVSIFVIMGAILNAGEAGQGFMNLATAAAGNLKGGAAKVSVLASAFFGSISGSASANVASTGAITLPAMLKLGYPRAFAAAVEAVASSGGQIMPPLMGAGAFVMVELTGVPYTSIMLAALLPAILYFLTVWIGINAFTSRYPLKPVDILDQPTRREVLITTGFFAIPFAVLLERMFIGGYTPQFAACTAILIAAILLFTDGSLTFSWSRTRDRFESAAITAGRQISVISSIILCASIVIGVLAQTGLGVKITSLILSGSGGYLWPALILTAIACLILGMEVPTTAAYVICVSVAGPALIELGLEPLQAHLFVFWYALLSTITPPVCGAVFIAAGMINENWLKVALSAMALGVGLYLIPLAMIASPEIIAVATTPLPAFVAFIKLSICLFAISYGLIANRLSIVRLFAIVSGMIVIFVF